VVDPEVVAATVETVVGFVFELLAVTDTGFPEFPVVLIVTVTVGLFEEVGLVFEVPEPPTALAEALIQGLQVERLAVQEREETAVAHPLAISSAQATLLK